MILLLLKNFKRPIRLAALFFPYIILLSWSSPAHSSGTDENLRTEYYYRLNSLEQASPPENLIMIKTGSSGSGQVSVNSGTLFTYKNRKALKVRLCGSFSAWKPVAMERNRNGLWYYYLENRDSGIHDKTIRYKYMVDSILLRDPENRQMEDDGMGSFLSLHISPPAQSGFGHTYRFDDEGNVIFSIFSPRAAMITLVGDFNRWNPENDLLTKNASGLWTIRKKILPGTYRYRFLVDGSETPDIYNEKSSSDPNGDLCSLIIIGRRNN